MYCCIVAERLQTQIICSRDRQKQSIRAERLRDQYEDLCKYEIADGRIRVMYLIANQIKVDGKMLLRKAGYTGGAYREQYEGKVKDIFPVAEFIFYWGRPRWRSSRDLRQMFKKRSSDHNIP